MKIVVIGGTGLIGSKVVSALKDHGHEAVPASPSSGVNSVTGEGLAEAFKGADVVVDVSNAPSWDDADVMAFFTASTQNLLDAEKAAGVDHHVALSVVGAEKLTESGYFRAKIAQEELIKASGQPFTIVRATQFFEFVPGIADAATDEAKVVHLPSALIQPIAAVDVATAVARAAVGEAINGTNDVAGPDQFGLDSLVRLGLSSVNDPREVITDADAPYYMTIHLTGRELVPEGEATIFETRYKEWLASK